MDNQQILLYRILLLQQQLTSILCHGNNKLNLGSSAKPWKNIYLSDDVFIDGSRFLSNGRSTSNVFVGNDAGLNTTAGFNTGVGHQSLYRIQLVLIILP